MNPAVPAKDMATLFAYIKKNPGQVNFATPGKGTPQHLAMELLKSRYGLDIVHVPYKGIAGAITDLIGGRVQMMFATVHPCDPSSRHSKDPLCSAPPVPNAPPAGARSTDLQRARHQRDGQR